MCRESPLCTGVKLYQDGHRLVTGYTHCDAIVLPSLGYQAVNAITQYPTQSYYPNTVLTSPCPVILMASTRLGSDKYQLSTSLAMWIVAKKESLLCLMTPLEHIDFISSIIGRQAYGHCDIFL